MSENSNLGVGVLTGAALGAGAGAFIPALQPVKKAYKTPEALMKLDADTFQREVLENKKVDKLSDEGKTALETLKTAREEYAQGSADLEAFLNKNAGSVGPEMTYKPEGGSKTIAELQGDITTAAQKVNVSEDEAVKAAKEELDALPKAGQKGYKKAATKAAEEKLAQAEMNAILNNEDVKNAQKLVNDAKAERFEKIERAIAEGSDENLKKGLAEAKDIMKKINEGTLKDFNMKNIRKILPKNKWFIALYAGIGAILGAIMFGGNKSANV